MAQSARIDRRFRGPPASANGGYACGVVGTLIGGAAEVTLRSPPPLDTELRVERDAEGVRLTAGGRLVAAGLATTVDLDVPPPPSFDEANAASVRYRWGEGHPFPGCFVCGPDRAVGDGLRLFPGATDDGRTAAAPFVPDASLADSGGRVVPEVVWAALDCPSWFGFYCFHELDASGVLLGRLAARIDARPRVGDRCVCTGWFIGREGRKIHCGSALHGEDGVLLAVARATWVTAR